MSPTEIDAACALIGSPLLTTRRYVRNITTGSLRPALVQAVEDKVIAELPWPGGLKWPKWKPPGADPFDGKERERLLEFFRTKTYGMPGRGRQRRPHPPYHVYLHLLFWTGLRPSEASGLQVGDLDLARARLHVQRSHHTYDTGDPETGSADRRWWWAHANDFHDLLVTHEGWPIPEK